MFDAHSTLEVCPVLPKPQPDLQVAYDTTLPAVATECNTFPEAVKESHDDISLAQIEQNLPSPQSPDRRIWGMNKKTWWILAVMLVLIITAVGVGVGVWKAKKDSTGDKPKKDSAGDKPTRVVSNESKLSAVNWTYGQHNYEAVFWQATNSSLMMSLWDSDNTTWEVVDIAKRITNNVTIAPALGTSLAAAAYAQEQPKFRLFLVYTNENNELQGLQTGDDPRGQWTMDLITVQGGTTSGSQLAVMWNSCGLGCAKVFYVGDDQSLMSVQRMDNTKPAKIANAKNIRRGSGMAVVAIDSSRDTNGSDIQAHAFFDQSNTLQEAVLSPYPSFSKANITCTMPTRPLQTQLISVPKRG
jgi:hypothetical protein